MVTRGFGRFRVRFRAAWARFRVRVRFRECLRVRIIVR